MNEQEIFSAALEQNPQDRPAFLDSACGDDLALRQRIERLLDLASNHGSFLQKPAPEVLATEIPEVTERAGDTIGSYKLLQQIGEGGMGVVYMAEQTEPVERRVALKIIKPGMDTHQVIARFEAERQALALMDHPNIAHVLDAGTTDTGRPYFVMELVKGLPITQYCDEQHLTPRERLELFLPICQAVQHAHQKGVIHRDLKPSNILVARYDDRAVPKIIDFGVAKAVSQRLTEKTMFTQYGQIVGTIEYMSPEQAQFNQLDVDTRSDVYSLGVLLYELLTGETPFDRHRLRAAAFEELLRIIREEEPPRPSMRLSSNETLPSIAANRRMEPKKLSTLVRGELDWIVMKALEKDRARRYETASAFAADVQHYLNNEAVLACPPSAVYRIRKFVRRNRQPVLAAAVVLVAMVAGIVGTTCQAVRATKAEVQARASQQAAEDNFRKARQAVDEYYTQVSENMLLTEPALEPLREQLLQNALRYYQGFVEQHADEGDLQAELAATYLRIAHLQFQSGQEDWLAAVQKAADMVEQLLSTDPNPATLAPLNVEFTTLPYLFHVREHDEALRTFERGRELWEGLVERDPSARGFRRQLAQIYLSIAVLQQHQSNTAAMQSAQQAVELLRQLLQEDPGNLNYRTALAGSLKHVGLFAAVAGQLVTAEDAMQESFAIAEQIAADYPDVTVYRERVYGGGGGGMLIGLGYVREHAGRLEDAEAVYRRVLAGRESLVTDHPTIARYKLAVLDARFELGTVLWSMGRHDEAAEEFRQSRDVGEQLAAEYPVARDYLAWLLADCPDVQIRDPQRAIELARTNVDETPLYGDYWTTLGIAYYRAGEYQSAAEALEKAIELSSFYGSSSCFFLAMARARTGQPDEARSWYDQGAARLEQHELKFAETVRLRNEAAELLGIEVR